MIVSNSFKFSEIEFRHMRELDFKKYLDYSKRGAIKYIADKIFDHIPLQQAAFDEKHYTINLLIVPTEYYLSIKQQLSELLGPKLGRETYLRVGELLKQIENCNENPLP